MAYAPKRKAISAKTRAIIFERDGGICWICKGKIEAGQPWDADHTLSRELGGSDDIENLAPAHRDPCHRMKSKEDVRLIAKGNRLIRSANPATRKSPKVKIHSRGFSKALTKGFDGVVRKK